MPEIHFVREHAYLAGIRTIHESAECLTHLAQLHHPEHGTDQYYLKHYLDGALRSKGLMNEVCGHILANAAGLPLAGHPLLVQLPAELIGDMHPDWAARIGTSSVLAWATLDVGGPALPRSGERVDELLRRWGPLGDLIAFDSWVVIPDRSSVNLARRRDRQMVVIDHGHMAGSVFWTSDTLPLHDDRRHPFLSRLWVGQVPEATNQRIIVAAEGQADCLERAEPELIRWADALPGGEGDRIALLEFLNVRAKDSPARMKRVLHLLA